MDSPIMGVYGGASGFSGGSTSITSSINAAKSALKDVLKLLGEIDAKMTSIGAKSKDAGIGGGSGTNSMASSLGKVGNNSQWTGIGSSPTSYSGKPPSMPGGMGMMGGAGGAILGTLGRTALGLGLVGAGTAWEYLPSAQEAVETETLLHFMGTRQNFYGGTSTQKNIMSNLMGGINKYAVGGKMEPLYAAYTFSNFGIQNQPLMKELLQQNQGFSMMTGLPNSSVAAAQAGMTNGPMAAKMMSIGVPVRDIWTGDLKGTQQVLESLYARTRRPGQPVTPELVQESYYSGALGANLRAYGFTPEQQQIALQYFTQRAKKGSPLDVKDLKQLEGMGFSEENANVQKQWRLDRSKAETLNQQYDRMANTVGKTTDAIRSGYDYLNEATGLLKDIVNGLANVKAVVETMGGDPAASTFASGLGGILSGIGLGALGGGLMRGGLRAGRTLLGKFGGAAGGASAGGGSVGAATAGATGLRAGLKFLGPVGAIIGSAVHVVGKRDRLGESLGMWRNAWDNKSPADAARAWVDSLKTGVEVGPLGMAQDMLSDIASIFSGGESILDGGNDGSYTVAMNKLANKMESLLGNTRAFGSNVRHRCLGNVQDAWQSIGGINNHRLGTAAQAAAHMSDDIRQGKPPRGALLLWNSSIGGGAGHIAVADGRGNAVNNWGGDRIERTPLSSMKKGYLGWAYPHEGLGKHKANDWLQGDGPEGKKAGGASGQALADYAKKFVGTPYLRGGRSPKGWDCAGFVHYVAKHFGINTAWTSEGLLKNGSQVPVAAIRPGDIIIYRKTNTRGLNGDGHAAIALGGGQVVHAGSRGTTISSVRGAAPDKQVVGVRRIIGGSVGSGPASSSAIGTGTPEAGTLGYTNVNVGSAGMTVTTTTIAETLGSAGGVSGTAAIGMSAGTAVGESPTQGTTARGGGNRAKVWNMLVDKGFTNQAAAGIIGNLMQESGVDPKSNQGGGGPGRGIMQWTVNERWASLQTWAKKRGMNSRDLDTQVGFMIKEMKDYGVYNKIRRMDDYKEATKYFEDTMERAGIPNMENRYKYAREALKQFGRGGYSEGSYRISRDEDARVHAGEMIIPADKAQEVRHAMAGVMSGGNSGGHTFNIYVPPGTTEEQARILTRHVIDALDRRDSTKRMVEI